MGFLFFCSLTFLSVFFFHLINLGGGEGFCTDLSFLVFLALWKLRHLEVDVSFRIASK